MNLIALSEHVFHVAALVFVIAVIGFLIVVAVGWKLQDMRSRREPRGGFIYDRNRERLP